MPSPHFPQNPLLKKKVNNDRAKRNKDISPEGALRPGGPLTPKVGLQRSHDAAPVACIMYY